MIYIIKLIVVFVTYMGVGTFVLNNDFKFKISDEEMTNLDYKIQQQQQLKQELYDLDNKLKKDIQKEINKKSYRSHNEKNQLQKKIKQLKREHFFKRKEIINKY